jgi:hypothetical protein
MKEDRAGIEAQAMSDKLVSFVPIGDLKDSSIVQDSGELPRSENVKIFVQTSLNVICHPE